MAALRVGDIDFLRRRIELHRNAVVLGQQTFVGTLNIRPVLPRVTAHGLRHTAASLAISSGANPKVVQRMLGHASAAMTLDVYADLFESDLDDVAVTVSKMCPRWADSQ
jgi:integrase